MLTYSNQVYLASAFRPMWSSSVAFVFHKAVLDYHHSYIFDDALKKDSGWVYSWYTSFKPPQPCIGSTVASHRPWGWLTELWLVTSDLYGTLTGDMKQLLAWIRGNMLKERPELFMQGDTVRPGILVLINDADWELMGELDYQLQDKDNVVFISTLHGG